MHISVALDRCIELLTPAINKSTSPVFVDATLGLGGHSFEMLKIFPNLTLVGIDRDTSAIEKASARLSEFGNRVHIAHSVFDHFNEVVKSFGFEKIDAALFDLGVSSMQLDVAERGFSYSQDAPLDMRMDQTQGITAEEIVNTWSHGDLTRILRVYGEEKFAPRIADFIIREREIAPIKTTAALAALVKNAIPAAASSRPEERTSAAARATGSRAAGSPAAIGSPAAASGTAGTASAHRPPRQASDCSRLPWMRHLPCRATPMPPGASRLGPTGSRGRRASGLRRCRSTSPSPR